MCMCVPVWTYEGQRVSDSLGHLIWMLETKPRPSVRALNALNH